MAGYDIPFANCVSISFSLSVSPFRLGESPSSGNVAQSPEHASHGVPRHPVLASGDVPDRSQQLLRSGERGLQSVPVEGGPASKQAKIDRRLYHLEKGEYLADEMYVYLPYSCIAGLKAACAFAACSES